MNLSTLAYKLITGEFRTDREHVRQIRELQRRRGLELQYAGAEPGTKRPSPPPLNAPEDYRNAQQRIVLIRCAQQLEEDFPLCDGILGEFETYVVGDLSYRAATGNPEADAVINDFLDWQFDSCDYSQRFDLTKLARLAMRSQKRDGGIAWLPVEEDDRILINAVTEDRIGNPLVGTNWNPNDYQGIRVDPKSEAPVEYDIYRRASKLNNYTFQQTVKARNLFYFFDPFRQNQYHGVTAFKNSIEHAYDIKQIVDFTKLNIKWRSSQLPYVTNEQGRPRGNGYEPGGTTANGTARPMSVQVDGVTQSFLKIDEGVMDYPNDFPNQQFTAVMEALKRDCSIGCKLPLEFVYQSMSGGVVQRFFADKARNTFLEDKRWLKKVLLNPTKNRIIEAGIKSGMLDLRPFGNLAKSLTRFRGTWQMGREISVDFGKEVDANIKLVDGGFLSSDDYITELGGNPDIVRRKVRERAIAIIKDAQAVSAATGVPFDQVIPFISKKFPNPAPVPGGGAPMDTEDSVDETDPPRPSVAPGGFNSRF